MIQMSTNKEMYNKVLLYSHNEIVTAIKRNKLVIHAATDEYQSIMLSKGNKKQKSTHTV